MNAICIFAPQYKSVEPIHNILPGYSVAYMTAPE